MNKGTLSQQLTSFTSNLKFADIPADALYDAKLHVLDAIGISLANADSDAVQTVKKVMVRLGTTPESTVIGSKEKYSAPAAAMVNSTMAHGPDFDDTHEGSTLHASAVLVPASLAVAESVNASGRDFITATVAGYETGCRMAMTAPGVFPARGFHVTALFGSFGSALIAGKLKGLSEDVICHALGIVGSQSAGILEFLTNGSAVKQMQPGWAAYSGIIATMLAEEGMTGPTTVFEGRYGFFNTHLPDDIDNNLEAVTAGLGRQWEVKNISFKSYPCCHHTQSFLDCTKEIMNNNTFSVEDIEDVECIISPKQANVICIPLEAKHAPKSDYDAKFSLPYVIAVMLHRGKVTLRDFTEEAIKDESVLQLTRKVRYTTSDHTGFPIGFPGWVKITLKDGRILEHRLKTNLLSVPGYPLVETEIINKFEDNALILLPSDRVKGLKELVLNIEDIKDISELTEYMQV